MEITGTMVHEHLILRRQHNGDLALVGNGAQDLQQCAEQCLPLHFSGGQKRTAETETHNYTDAKPETAPETDTHSVIDAARLVFRAKSKYLRTNPWTTDNRPRVAFRGERSP